MKVKPIDVGRFVRVIFDDVGAQDGVIVEVDGPNDFRFLPCGGKEHISNNGAPAVALGKWLSAKDSGL